MYNANVVREMFSLQFFADVVYHGTGGFVNPETGNTQEYDAESGMGLSPEMKVYYAERLLRKAGPKLVHEQFGKSAPIPARKGDRAEYRIRKTMGKASKPLVEGVTPAPEKMTIVPIYADVEQYGSWIGLTDKISLVAIDPLVSEATMACSEQASLTLDTVVREVINSGTSVSFAKKNNGTENASETAGRYEIDKTCLLTVADVFKMAAFLRAKNAPTKDGYFVAIAHPYVIYDLMMGAPDKTWKDVMSYAKPENMLKGEVGELGGVRFVQTSEAKIFKGAPLAANGEENLTVKSVADNVITVNEALSENELDGRFVLANNNLYEVKDNTATTITVEAVYSAGEISKDFTEGATVYPGEGGKNNCAVFSTLFIAGSEAYGVVDIGGKGAEIIAKPLGAGDDQLNQRSSVGWKAYKGAVILHPEYMIRYESGSTLADSASAN